MNKEIKIGLVGLLSIIVLFVGINYLKGLNVLDSSRDFYAIYDDIGGLKPGSAVSFNGYQVGMVSKINFLNDLDKRLIVSINIDKDFKIPLNSVFKIVNQDIMGSKSINLILGNDNVFAQSGDTLIAGAGGSFQDEVSAQILPLKIKTEELIGSIDSVMIIITAVLNKDARNNLTNSLKSLDQTFSLMSETMIKVDQIVDQNDDRISSIVKNLQSSNNQITNILKNFSDISDDIAKSNIQDLLISSRETIKKINDSNGSLGMLINDKDLYLNLEKSTKELELLIKDIKTNPKRYVGFSVLGSKSKKSKTQK